MGNNGCCLLELLVGDDRCCLLEVAVTGVKDDSRALLEKGIGWLLQFAGSNCNGCRGIGDGCCCLLEVTVTGIGDDFHALLEKGMGFQPWRGELVHLVHIM